MNKTIKTIDKKCFVGKFIYFAAFFLEDWPDFSHAIIKTKSIKLDLVAKKKMSSLSFNGNLALQLNFFFLLLFIIITNEPFCGSCVSGMVILFPDKISIDV